MSLPSDLGGVRLDKMTANGPGLDIIKPPKYPGPYPNDLDARDELRERELEEARARAAQMEKTMRWWSDCTANWREKWGKVRAERNNAREENRQLKLKLESSVKDIAYLRREKQDAIEARIRLERDVEKLERELKKDKRLIPSARVEPSMKTTDGTDGIDSVYDRTVPKAGGEQQFIEQILEKNELYEANGVERSKSIPGEDKKRRKRQNHKEENFIDDSAPQQVRILQMKLEESERLLADERSSKSNLVEEIECLQSDLTSLKFKNEELLSTKVGTQSELFKLKTKYDKDVDSLNADLDEAYEASSTAGKVKELRAEIERLQNENTLEWSKREKLESEKIALERESKKLKHQIQDMESLLSHKTARASKMMDTDLKQIQEQLDEKTTELVDSRYAYNKVKKQLQEKTAELEHSRKRVEQHDSEVRKLRMRVEELKLELAKAEDEIDAQANKVRKTQRSLDEQTERAESLQVQVQHLTSRLRSTSVTTSSVGVKYGRVSRSTSLLSSDDSDLD